MGRPAGALSQSKIRVTDGQHRHCCSKRWHLWTRPRFHERRYRWQYIWPHDCLLTTLDIDKEEWPEEPILSILSVDMVGVLYTVKLALHRFERQYLQDQHNTSNLILQTSIAAYLCQPGSPQYNAAKFGKRGLMRCLRETSLKHGTRVNSIAPWSVPKRMTSFRGS